VLDLFLITKKVIFLANLKQALLSTKLHQGFPNSKNMHKQGCFRKK